MASPVVWYIQFLWHVVKWVGCERESNEEYDKDFIKEGFQLGREKLGKSGDRSKLAIELGRWSIIIWGRAGLKLALSVSCLMVQILGTIKM